MPAPVRRVLLLAHTGREEAREVARAFVKALASNEIRVRALAGEAADLGLDPDELEIADDEASAADDCELAIVIGGDGTVLRAAEITHDHGTPLLGVNLGHVGFLAEAEPDAVESTVGAIVERRYTSEERLTIDVSRLPRRRAGHQHLRPQRGERREGRPRADARGRRGDRRAPAVAVRLRRRGLRDPDGIHRLQLLARAGRSSGRSVEALLMVPISAHALFARPLVVAPSSVLAVEVLARTEGAGVLWCDGRRTVDLPPGARIEVRRGAQAGRFVRLHEAPFTDRLVAKFGLSVQGWRGASDRRRGWPDA